MFELKILKIEFKDINIFNEGFAIDFYAEGRVSDKEYVYRIKNSIYTQKVISLVGINASGKTTALKLINFALNVVITEKSIANAKITPGIIAANGKDSTMTVHFINGKYIYKLVSVISEKNDNDVLRYFFKSEKIYRKPITNINSKYSMFDFDEERNLFLDRNKYINDNEVNILKPTDSIIASVTMDTIVKVSNTFFDTNINIYHINGNIDNKILNVFDDSIEKISNHDNKVDILFKNGNAYEVKDIAASNILSSGTIKGNNLVYEIKDILASGGYLIIDELENHFNKKIAELIIDLFQNDDINKNGACLIFSTHYIELIDTIERTDNTYLIRKNKYNSENNSFVTKFREYNNRGDKLKSEVFLSNVLKGSAPSYENIENLKEFLRSERNN